MKFRTHFMCFIALMLAFSGSSLASNNATLEGKVWHTTVIPIIGPEVSESSASTFANYRYTVELNNGNVSMRLPGFFAADGRAEYSHATQGNVWLANFVPPQAGTWRYTATLEYAENLALRSSTSSGRVLQQHTGIINVASATLDINALDFKLQGRLTRDNSHIQHYAGTAQPFIKTGAGSPENLLAFTGFDGTFDAGEYPRFPSLGESQLHQYRPHIQDWHSGDPLWQSESGGDSKGIVGMMNYLAAVGVNSFYFMTLTYHGDGWDVWPWVEPESFYYFDVSKLAQWQLLFEHMQTKGIHLHLLLSETENENLFELREGGDFADARKLYYREMVARFGHHLALTWNLGEESGWDDEKGLETGLGNSDEQRLAFTHYLRQLDPYNNPIKAHEIEIVDIFTAMEGNPAFDGPSLQRHENYNAVVSQQVLDSYARNNPWLVSMDEPLGWEFGLRPNGPENNYTYARQAVLWGSLMGGAHGIEWYFGWQNNAPSSDLSSEDMRLREPMWLQSKSARELLVSHVELADVLPNNDLIKNKAEYLHAYALTDSESQVVVYLAPDEQVNAPNLRLDLTGFHGEWVANFYTAVSGETIPSASVNLQSGQITLVPIPSIPTQDMVIIFAPTNK